MPKSICIVGNGPSLLCKRKGADIDSCDTVVRINRYVIDPERINIHDTGQRISVWATTKEFKMHQPYIDWIQRPAILVVNRNHQNEHTGAFARKYSDKYNVPVACTSSKLYRRMCEECRKYNGDAYPSTGLLVIAWYLEQAEKENMEPAIYIVGFDNMKPARLHYYDDVEYPGANPAHYYEAEVSIIDNWKEKGLIKEL